MPLNAPSWQCLTCRLSQLSISRTRRQLSTSAPKRARKSPYPNVTAKDLGLINSVQRTEPGEMPGYTDEEKKLLHTKYSEEQMAIIEMGEKAIPSSHLRKQGLQRTDPNRIAYFDDFSTLRPVIDYAVESEDTKETKIIYKEKSGAGTGDNVQDPETLRLSQQTGLTSKEIAGLRTKTLVKHRVVNQTRMGKISSMYYLAIAGNQNGMLGIGEGKSAEDADAEKQARSSAIRNMKPIPRYEDRTIYGDVEAKVAATIVQLQSRPPGFGNRCQHLIFEMARTAGIQDLAARTPRSRNKMNVVKAAYQALMKQRTPEDIARSRGRKMIDVRKVYYGGSVP